MAGAGQPDDLQQRALQREARRKAGRLALARATYLDAAALAQARGDHAGLARAALGLHAVGAKTGPSAEREQAIGLLQQAAEATGLAGELGALVDAALARDLYHSLDASRTDQAGQLASRAVTLARRSGGPWALARCLIAAHDVRWRPGSARDRLTILDELLALARQLRSADLTAQARLLRATALLELGSPAAHAELDLFCQESEQLGDAAARWDAQSRRAAAALLAGRAEEAGVRPVQNSASSGSFVTVPPDWQTRTASSSTSSGLSMLMMMAKRMPPSPVPGSARPSMASLSTGNKANSAPRSSARVSPSCPAVRASRIT